MEHSTIYHDNSLLNEVFSVIILECTDDSCISRLQLAGTVSWGKWMFVPLRNVLSELHFDRWKALFLLFLGTIFLSISVTLSSNIMLVFHKFVFHILWEDCNILKAMCTFLHPTYKWWQLSLPIALLARSTVTCCFDFSPLYLGSPRRVRIC